MLIHEMIEKGHGFISIMVFRSKWGRLKEEENDTAYQLIFENFIEPLYKAKPESWDRAEWMAYLFRIDTVKIEKFKTLRKFTLRGLKERTTPRIFVINHGKEYTIKKDVVCFIRYDMNDSSNIEIEIPTGNGHKSFKVDSTEFELYFEHNLEKMNNLMDDYSDKSLSKEDNIYKRLANHRYGNWSRGK